MLGKASAGRHQTGTTLLEITAMVNSNDVAEVCVIWLQRRWKAVASWHS